MFSAYSAMMTNAAEKSMPPSGGITRFTGASSGSHRLETSVEAGL